MEKTLIDESISIHSENQAEMSLLGGCLQSINWVNQSIASLLESDFFSQENRHIFATIKDLYSKDSQVTFQAIEARMDLKTCSLDHLVDCLSLGNLAYDMQDLIEDIKEASKKRNLQRIGYDFLKDTSSQTRSSKEILQSLEEQIFSASEGIQPQILKPIKDVLDKPIPFLQEIQNRQELHAQGISAFKGIPTGFYDLDKSLKGLISGHVTIIGARPGVGKTTLALNILENLVTKYRSPVMFFSLEMPATEVANKLICQRAQVSMQKLSDGSLNGEEFQRINVAYHALKEQIIIIDDQPSILIDQFKARCIRSKRIYGIKAVFIDYVQLMRSNRKGTDQRHLEIGDISRRLKETAKELEIPIIALAQLNREVDKRTDKRPYLSDLRESGSLEADADEILLLHRPDMLDPYDQPGVIHLHIAKNRFGPTGIIKLAFSKETGCINNYAPFTQPG